MDIDETLLPGIGVRHDLMTRQDTRVGDVAHRTGIRELLVYDQADPDGAGLRRDFPAPAGDATERDCREPSWHRRGSVR